VAAKLLFIGSGKYLMQDVEHEGDEQVTPETRVITTASRSQDLTCSRSVVKHHCRSSDVKDFLSLSHTHTHTLASICIFSRTYFLVEVRNESK
jgi:hypothetical protein